MSRPRVTSASPTAGPPVAVATVLDVAGAAVWSLCRRLDPEPEDAFQAVMLRVAEVVHRFDPRGAASLRTWVITLAHRCLVDRHRRRVVRGEVLALPDLPTAARVEEEVDARRRAEALERALASLPAEQRRVVVLHHLEGLDLAAIAEVEGIALGTVKSRLHRGRGRLLVWLGGVL